MHRRAVHSAVTTKPTKAETRCSSSYKTTNGVGGSSSSSKQRLRQRWFSKSMFSGTLLGRSRLARTVMKGLLVIIPLVILYYTYVILRLSRADFTLLTKDWGLGYYTPILPYDKHYVVEDAYERAGDRTHAYATLRKDVDSHLNDPVQYAEHLSFMNAKKHKFDFHPMQNNDESQQPVYDVYNCPLEPPKGYPYLWKTVDLLHDWSPDDTTPPATIYQSICVFDFTKDYDKAIAYREASLPFIVANDPAVTKSAVRWSMPDYLKRLFRLRSLTHKTGYAESNHFMFHKQVAHQLKVRGANGKLKDLTPKDWQEPTKELWMTYDDFVSHANVSSDHAGPGSPHWYMQMTGCGNRGNDGSCSWDAAEFFFDELTFFQPHANRPSNRLYLYKPEVHSSGITCRFGMDGIVYESHFDRNSNALALITGSRRYILSPPDQCQHQALFPYGHPSARHSAVDWSHPDLEQYPEFAKSLSTEFVLQAGEVLYLPSNWFHFIVSLDMNAQCNSWALESKTQHLSHIEACGF